MLRGRSGVPMGHRARAAAAVLVLFAGARVPLSGRDPAPRPNPLLTASEVERETGLHGLRRLSKRGGRPLSGVRFETSDGKPLLSVVVSDAVSYARWKGRRFRAAVAGVGDEAFSGPPRARRPEAVYFRKGDRSAALSAAVSGGEPRVHAKALERLARLVAARLP